SLAVFMSSLDLFIVNLAFPYISKDYPGTSLSSLSWVLNAYTIVFAAVLVPAGRWADRIGRRRLFSAGLVLFSFGSVLCGLAPGPAGRRAGQRRGHGVPLAAAPLPGDRARTAPLAHVQRVVRRVDPVLRRVRGVRAQLGGVPHRRVALLRGGGRPGHRARTA